MLVEPYFGFDGAADTAVCLAHDCVFAFHDGEDLGPFSEVSFS